MFDPAQPANNSALSSAVMRSQLTSLKALIDAISAITQAQVDSVSTLNPGDPATATASIIGDSVHFTFAIPQGQPGSNGSNGSDGPPGPPGPQGPPFASAVVDGVTTLPAGDPASVSVSFDGSLVHFTFSIPQGQSGPPGEVTMAQMDTAIAAAVSTTARNPTSISPLAITFTDPPTAAELTQVQDKINALLGALTRTL